MAVVNITLITNGDFRTDKVPDSMTLRGVYEKYGVNYQRCTNTVNSVPVGPANYDEKLSDLTKDTNIRLSSIVKADNAAKVFVGGSAAIVKSAYKLDQWKKALKYDPEFGVYNDQDEPIFRVFVTEGPGSLTEDGAEFSDVADEEGFATITILVDPSVENKKEMIKDQIGLALIYLNDLEERLEEVLKDADKYDKEIDEMVKSI